MNTGVAKAGLGIKRPLVGTETNTIFQKVQMSELGIKRPLVGTETLSHFKRVNFWKTD